MLRLFLRVWAVGMLLFGGIGPAHAADPIRMGRGEVTDLAVSPDGLTLAVATTAGLWLYSTADLNAAPRLLDGHTAALTRVAFRPDGAQALSAGRDNLAVLWMLPDGPPTPLKGHTKPITAIAYSPDGSLIATADQEIRLWESATGKGRGILNDKQKSGTVTSLTFSPDGSRLIAAGADGHVRIWDVARKALLKVSPAVKKASVTAYALDSTVFYLASDDSVWAWPPDGGQPTAKITFDRENMSAAAFSADRATVAFASSARKLHLIRLPDLQSVADFSTESTIRAAAFSPDGRTLYTSSADNTIRALNVQAGKAAQSLIGAHGGPVRAAALSGDGKRAAFSIDDDSLIRVADAETGAILRLIENGITAPGLVFLVDGSLAAIAGRDVRLYQPDRGVQVGTLASGGEGRLTVIALSRNGAFLAAADGVGMIYVWAVGRGRLVHTFKGHTSELVSLAFSADSTRLISAGEDGTLRVWGVSQ